MATLNVVSETMICNLALTRAGSTQQITSMNDGSNEAAQCLIWYPQDRDATLTDWSWPWAEAFVVLVEVAGPETTQDRANAVWMRSYRWPSNCLKMRRIVPTPFPIADAAVGVINYFASEPWRRAVGDALPISYGLSSDDTGRLITTDEYGNNGITAAYTMAVNDPTQFDADFVDLLAWRLAADLAMGLGRDDAKRTYAAQGYERVKGSTRAAHGNQVQSDIPKVRWQSETVRARWSRGKY